MEQIIEKINKLNESISNLKSFLGLLEDSDKVSKYGKGNVDEFHTLYVSSDIWTGSNTSRYERSIRDKEVINELSKVMKVVLTSKITEKEFELKSLLK